MPFNADDQAMLLVSRITIAKAKDLITKTKTALVRVDNHLTFAQEAIRTSQLRLAAKAGNTGWVQSPFHWKTF